MAKSAVEKTRDQIHARLAYWLQYFGLSHTWHTELVWEEVGEGGMSANWSTNYRDVVFKISPSFAERNVRRHDKIDEFVIHELLHILLSPLRDLMDNNFQIKSPLYTAYGHAEEGVLDEITRIMRRLSGEDEVCFRSVTTSTPSGSSTKTTPPENSADAFPRRASRKSPSPAKRSSRAVSRKTSTRPR